MLNNQYERAFDQALKEQNKDYFVDLNGVLKDFEKYLIEAKILSDDKYSSYVNLLKQISLNPEKDFGVSYNLDECLDELSTKYEIENDLVSIGIKINKYLDSRKSKTHLYGKKIKETSEGELNRARIASILLEVFDENDFELSMVKLKFFKILNPKSELVFYKFNGKTGQE